MLGRLRRWCPRLAGYEVADPADGGFASEKRAAFALEKGDFVFRKTDDGSEVAGEAEAVGVEFVLAHSVGRMDLTWSRRTLVSLLRRVNSSLR
jgi:hypothetical protein